MRKLTLISISCIISIISFAQNTGRWSAVGNGTDGFVRCFSKYKGSLIVGMNNTYSTSTSIAGWDGEKWSSLNGGVSGKLNPIVSYTSVGCMEVYKDKLYVGGNFVYANNDNPVECNGIACWDGSTWTSVGKGLDTSNIIIESVFSMAVYKDELYVGGSFTNMDGIPVFGIAKFNGERWSSVGKGLDDWRNSDNFFQGIIYALIVWNEELYVGGSFTYAEDVKVYNRAKWDGEKWSPVGDENNILNRIYSFAAFNGNLVAGCSIEDVDKYNLGVFDGKKWSSITGVRGDIKSLFVWNDSLYVGGEFYKLGHQFVNFIICSDGEKWHKPGTGTSSSVFCMENFNNALYVGGGFTSANGKTNHIGEFEYNTGVKTIYIAKWK